MTLHALWSLPKAAPAIMRHIGGYLKLAGLDLARTQREMAAQLLAFMLAAIAVFFAILMGCLAVVAYTWDTPYRLQAIAWMGGAFVALAVIASIYRSSLSRARSPLFGDVHREWQEDRVILDNILSDGEK